VPTIVTRGVASARGAGTFSAAPPPPPPPPPTPTPPPPPPPGPPPVFQTVTFNSSGVWTAPSGVSIIQNLQVAGGLYSFSDGFFSFDSTGNIYAARYTPSFDSPGSSDGLSYINVASYSNAVLRNFNSGGTGDRFVTYDPIGLYWNSSTNGYYWGFESSVTLRINGVAQRLLGPWDNNSPALVGGPTQPPTEWSIGVQVYNEGGEFPGSPSSAFGFTAAGTTSAGQPQVIVSSAAVSVTPGQQYSIEVGGASGYVQFQFSQS
jgi:hypothetical protein